MGLQPHRFNEVEIGENLSSVFERTITFIGESPPNKANAADCQSKAFIVSDVARHGNFEVRQLVLADDRVLGGMFCVESSRMA